MKYGQVSVEYLSVIGLSLLMIIPLLVVFAMQSQGFQEDVNTTHLEKVGTELIASAEETFYLGPPTQKQLHLYFPDNLESITFESQAIVFTMERGGSSFEFPATSNLPLNLSGSLSLHSGPHTISVQAEETGIVIQDVS